MERADGHRYYEGLAVAHVLGGLDDTEGQVFRAHLLECVDCRARVGELRAIAHDLADVERDERRVRAAQAIDTKRRDAEDGDEEADEVPEVTRASRVTVIVGLVLVIGLSLWNFTLRGQLTTLQQRYDAVLAARVLEDRGDEWRVINKIPTVDATVTQSDSTLVIALSGLDPKQLYGTYVFNEEGTLIEKKPAWLPNAEGGHYDATHLSQDAAKIQVMNPEDDGDKVAVPSGEPVGEIIVSAEP